MNRKLFLTSAMAAVTVPMQSAAREAETSHPDRPNVIYIMSDDHTSQSIGVYGSRLAPLDPTPTIDRIGREGAVFNNCFCTQAISTPSRACIMSGQYAQTTGVQVLGDWLEVEDQNLPRELNALGYQTAMIGKWHLYNPPVEFDYYKILDGQGTYFDPVIISKNEKNFTKNKRGQWIFGQTHKGYVTDILMDETLDYLENTCDKSEPFFLCVQFKAPHDMFENHPRYDSYLEEVEIPEPESLWKDRKHGSVATRGFKDSLVDTIGSSVGRRNVIRNMGIHMEIDTTLTDDEYKHAAYQAYLKRYLRCVKGVDDNVKRLFDYLEEHGLMDNTIIMYTGDQGFFLGEHDYIDKRWMYDEAMRMPLLVRYPEKIKAGTRVDAIVNNVDFAPTIINMCGGETPDYMQGDDFSEILFNDGTEPADWKQYTYYRYWMHMAHKHNNPAHFGIRTRQYKLIFFYGCDYEEDDDPTSLSNFRTPVAWEFYDLEKDPFEMNNLYGKKKYKKIIDDLKIKLLLERERLNETDVRYPHIQKIIAEHWNDWN